ncbi:unnamed protein product [Strongylus vulgaris]|uniref:Uncharacterized protein n=1 Tax=Strongylus vulgaris TaxID=40348 RepID=A0A3P7J256_STRVU|nr:unnamed protein product [Strongylus vulgaris]
MAETLTGREVIGGRAGEREKSKVDNDALGVAAGGGGGDGDGGMGWSSGGSYDQFIVARSNNASLSLRRSMKRADADTMYVSVRVWPSSRFPLFAPRARAHTAPSSSSSTFFVGNRCCTSGCFQM